MRVIRSPQGVTRLTKCGDPRWKLRRRIWSSGSSGWVLGLAGLRPFIIALLRRLSIRSCGSPLSAIATGALLGIRNGFYGMRMSSILKLNGIKKFFGAQITIDESTGVALSQESRGESAMRYGFFATGIGVFLFWNLFTLIGALGANSIGDPSSWGLDAAVPAAFLGLVWPRLIDGKTRIAALLSILLSLLLTPVLGSGLPIIATVVIALALGWRAR